MRAEDSEGRVSTEKFMESASNLLKKFNDENIGHAFDILDLNGTGIVSLKEIDKALQHGCVGESDAHGIKTSESFWK